MKKILLLFFIFSTFIFANMDELEELLMQDEIVEEEFLGGDDPRTRFEAIVKQIRGQGFVRYEKDESWKQLYEGAEIKKGAIALTLDSSEIIIELEDFTLIDIRPNTRVVFTSLSKDIQQEELSETGMKLLLGSVYSNVRKKLSPGSKYEIEVDGASAGVRGTKFMVWKSDDKNGVKVYDGIVSIISKEKDKKFSVGRKEFIEFNKQGEFSKLKTHNDRPPEMISKENQKTNITPGDIYELENIEIEEEEVEDDKDLDIESKDTKLFDENNRNLNEDVKANLTVEIK